MSLDRSSPRVPTERNRRRPRHYPYKEKREPSLRKPTLSRERKRKKKSACSLEGGGGRPLLKLQRAGVVSGRAACPNGRLEVTHGEERAWQILHLTEQVRAINEDLRGALKLFDAGSWGFRRRSTSGFAWGAAEDV